MAGPVTFKYSIFKSYAINFFINICMIKQSVNSFIFHSIFLSIFRSVFHSISHSTFYTMPSINRALPFRKLCPSNSTFPRVLFELTSTLRSQSLLSSPSRIAILTDIQWSLKQLRSVSQQSLAITFSGWQAQNARFVCNTNLYHTNCKTVITCLSGLYGKHWTFAPSNSKPGYDMTIDARFVSYHTKY